jgi:hypothetical protein
MRCITTKLRLRLAILLATQFGHVLVGGRPAQAQVVGGMRYGIVTIHNKTDVTINYAYRIGNGAWRQTSISPGNYRYYYHQYAFANENRSPTFHIRFDSDLGPGIAMKGYVFKRNPAAWPNADFGRHYNFKRTGGNRIDIYG